MSRSKLESAVPAILPAIPESPPRRLCRHIRCMLATIADTLVRVNLAASLHTAKANGCGACC